MRNCTDTFCPLDHIAIEVINITDSIPFFEEVLGMRIYRQIGPEGDPTSVWLDGGIQLRKAENPSRENGRFHHLAFQVRNAAAIVEKAKKYGGVPVPGKGAHWFMLPNGIRFELKEQPAE